MNFEKKLITESDVQEFKNKFGVTLGVGDSFVVNTERSCLLHSPRQDRWDMGGTTNTYWQFTYQNKNFKVACEMEFDSELDSDEFIIIITSIKEGDVEVKSVDDNFVLNFSDAYHVHNYFGDINPKERTDDYGDKYKFEFVGEIV